MTTGGRAGWATLFSLFAVALALRAADALSGRLTGVPKGVHACRSLDEAGGLTGLDLGALRAALADGDLVTERILRLRRSAVAVTLRPTQGAATRLSYFRSAGPVPGLLRPPLPAFHAIEVPLNPGRTATLHAASLGDGSVWQDLEWFEGTGRAALRGQGRTVDLLRLARRLTEGTP
jgi:hypothetical protein